MGYHRAGNAYVSTQEAVRHGATLFGLAVAICVAGRRSRLPFPFCTVSPSLRHIRAWRRKYTC